MSKQACLQGLVAVDWDSKPHDTSTLAVDMMAAIYAKQGPTTTLDNMSEVAAG